MPWEAFENDFGILVDLICSRKGGISRKGDDSVIVFAVDGTNTILELTVEEFIERLPSMFRHFGFIETEGRCVPKAQERSLLDRAFLAQVLSNILRELDYPVGQGSQWLADTVGVDGSLARTQGLLGENEIEDANDIVDVSTLGGLWESNLR